MPAGHHGRPVQCVYCGSICAVVAIEPVMPPFAGACVPPCPLQGHVRTTLGANSEGPLSEPEAGT